MCKLHAVTWHVFTMMLVYQDHSFTFSCIVTACCASIRLRPALCSVSAALCSEDNRERGEPRRGVGGTLCIRSRCCGPLQVRLLQVQCAVCSHFSVFANSERLSISCVCALMTSASQKTRQYPGDCSIWVTNRNEPLKATAASTLARLLRYNPGLLRFLLDKYGIRHLVAGTSDFPVQSTLSAVRDMRVSGQTSRKMA